MRKDIAASTSRVGPDTTLILFQKHIFLENSYLLSALFLFKTDCKFHPIPLLALQFQDIQGEIFF